MNLIRQFTDLVRSGTSASHFYRNMNDTLKRLHGQYTMLHYPMEGEGEHSFLQGQMNLTDFSVSLLGDLNGKQLLEVGCGNGEQARYICRTYDPASVTGIDLDPGNIEIANRAQAGSKMCNVLFLIDDAQELKEIASASMDVVINIESAFHYPDKEAFLAQVSRVLKPGGQFLVADLLTTKKTRGVGIRKLWKGKMILHHWDQERYKDNFNNGDLRLHRKVDITGQVIRGFRGYRRWINDIEGESMFRNFIYRIFYIINVEWVLYLLRRRRLYYVFVGSKDRRSLIR